MTTIPDNGTAQADPDAITLAGLRERYGEWEIVVRLDLPVVTAERRSADGRQLHYLAAHTVADLAAKLETATP